MKHFLWLLLLPAVVPSLPLVLNSTASIPIGLYRKTQDANAPYIGFCLDTRQLETARNAGAEFTPGACGGQPLLKPVLHATTTDPVTFSPQGFTWHGRLLPNTGPKPRTLTGKALTPYPFGQYTTGLWAVSTYTKDSYDSRYLGPIAEEQILYHAQPFFVINSH